MRVAVVGRILPIEQIGLAAGVVCRECEIGDRDVEPLVPLEVEVAQEEFAASFRIENGDLHGVHARGQDRFGREVAARVDRNRRPGQPDRVLRRDAAALDLDGSDVTERNVLGAQLARAIPGEQRIASRRLGGIRGLRSLADHPERLGRCFVETPLRVVDAQHVSQFAPRCREGFDVGGLPFAEALGPRSTMSRGCARSDCPESKIRTSARSMKWG